MLVLTCDGMVDRDPTAASAALLGVLVPSKCPSLDSPAAALTGALSAASSVATALSGAADGWSAKVWRIYQQVIEGCPHEESGKMVPHLEGILAC